MTALDNDRLTKTKALGLKAYPMAAVKIFSGGIVCANTSGFAAPGADTAGFTVLGIAAETVDNSGGSPGDKWIKVQGPLLALFAASSITQAMVGKTMYVIDDQTFDDTSTNGVMLGILMEFVSTTAGWVLIAPTTNPLISGLTASAAELNILDGALLDVNELNILNGVTATTSEINQYCDESAKTEIVAATNVLTAAESGKTMFLNHATEFVSTLPAPALGLNFRFIVSGAPSGASYTIVTNASANIIRGTHVSSDGEAGDNGQTDDTITFVDGQAVAGDMVEVWSDGTNWFAYATSKVAAGITFTTAA